MTFTAYFDSSFSVALARASAVDAARALDTLDDPMEQRFLTFLGEIHEPAQSAEQRLKQKLLERQNQAIGTILLSFFLFTYVFNFILTK